MAAPSYGGPPPPQKKKNIGGDVSPAVLTPENWDRYGTEGGGAERATQYMYNWLAYDRQHRHPQTDNSCSGNRTETRCALRQQPLAPIQHH